MARDPGKNEHDPEFEPRLLARIKDGEKEAFAELVRLHQRKIFTLAYGFFRDRDDALEIVQETFMRVYEKIGSYRPDHSLQSWIYRLARNLCVDYYRKHAKKRKLEDGFGYVPTYFSLVDVEGGHNFDITRTILADLPVHQADEVLGRFIFVIFNPLDQR